MIYGREGCALEHTSSGCWEVYVLYYTVKIGGITSHRTWLLSCKKPDAGPPPRYWNTLLKTRSQTRGVPKRININNDLFTLNFCIHLIYIYTSPYLRFQATWPCSSSPVESESEGDGLWSSDRCSHDHCRIPGFRALKRSGLVHTEQNSKKSFIRRLYNHK